MRGRIMMMKPATKALKYNRVIVPGIKTNVGTRPSTPWLLANLDLVPGTGLEPARPCGH